MKKILFIVFLSLNSIFIFSQKPTDKIIYFDSIGKNASKENHNSYRIIKDYNTEKELYEIKDYYKSGVLKMEGNSKTKDSYSREGEVISYYENTNKKTVSNYIKSRLNGKFDEWYENGNKKLEGEYRESVNGLNSDFLIYEYWDNKNQHSVIKGNGIFEENEDDRIITGNLKDGLKDGVWKSNYNKSKNLYIDLYKKGVFVIGKSIDSLGNEREYKSLELRPMPKKGIQDFYSFIGKNFNKTPEAIQNKITGKIFITFIIDKEGKIIEPKIVKSLGYGLDEEALRVIMNYENWNPGEQRGVKVRVSYTIPITVN